MGRLRALRLASRLVVTTAVVTGVAVLTSAPTAIAVSAPVTAVKVRGAGQTPAAVNVSWTVPGDASYAGARVVVVASSTPTTDPHDPGAVSTSDNASPETSVTVSGLSGGQVYSASVFAYDGSGSYSSGASATWTEPGTVTGLVASGADAGLGGVVHVSYQIPATVDTAVVCVAEDGAPPSAPTAPAQCGTNGVGDVEVVAGHTYGVAVFGASNALAGYGPPATTTVAVPDNAPLGATNALITSFAVDRHTADIAWMLPLDTGTVRDLKDWLVTRADGTVAAPADAAPIAIVPTPTRAGYETITYRATGLVANRPYTFSVRARDDGGNLSPPATVTVATRVPGTYVADDNDRTRRWHTARMPCPSDPETSTGSALTVSNKRALHTVFACAASPDPVLYYRSRAPGHPWTTRRRIGVLRAGSGAYVGVSPTGAVVVAWTSPSGPAVRARLPRHPWGAVHHLPALTRDAAGWSTNLTGLVVDAHNHSHVLLLQQAEPTARLFYATDVSGHWTHARIVAAPHSVGWTGARIAIDRATDAVVVATSELTTTSSATRSVVRISRTSARRATLNALTARADTARHLVVSDVAGAGGRIAVGLQAGPAPTAGGVFVMTGMAPATIGPPIRIAGSTTSDTALRIAMSTRNVVALAWYRESADWSPAHQGTFVALRRFDTARKTWTTTRPVQRSDSHYDAPVSLARDDRGHLYLGYVRAG